MALQWPDDQLEALPLAPLIYVAWSDGDLTNPEVDSIRERLCAIGGLEDRSVDLIREWLDPNHAPSARDLRHLLSAIRTSIPQLQDTVEYSITELGAALAPEIDFERTREAVREIESTIGIVGTEATRDVLAPLSRRDSQPVVIPDALVDVDALIALMDAPHADTRNRVRLLLSDSVFAYRYGLSTDDHRELVLEWLQRVAREGLGALAMPETAGGSGDQGGFIAAFETLATHDLSLTVKFGVQFGLFGGSVQALGTQRHHDAYLADIGSLNLPGCFAMTELGHGSNVWDLETTATYHRDSDCFIINTPTETARKEWIGNAACHGRMATVFAQLIVDEENYGVHAFLVPIRSTDGAELPGVTLEDCGRKEGLNGVDNGRIWFADVSIPRENLLDRFGTVDGEGNYDSPIASPSKRFFTMLGTLVGGRVSVAKAGLSAAKSGLAIAVRYGSRRRQFGPSGQEELPLLDYLTHQRRLMPRVATAYAIHFALQDLADQYVAHDDEDTREIEALAAGLKAYATRFATDTLQECREACGGQGYLAVNRLPQLKVDADIFATFEGDNTVLWQLVAKSILADFRDQFGELRLWGMVRFLADRAATRVKEKNPVTTRNTDPDHLRDAEFHLSALEYRLERLTFTAAARMRDRIASGMDSFLAFNECQDHLVALARAHVELVVYRAMHERVVSTTGSVHSALTLMRDVFVLWRLERDRAWFLEAGYFESAKSKAIRALLNDLVGEMRRHAVPLVDGFGIPDALLAAPIAFGIDPRE